MICRVQGEYGAHIGLVRSFLLPSLLLCPGICVSKTPILWTFTSHRSPAACIWLTAPPIWFQPSIRWVPGRRSVRDTVIKRGQSVAVPGASIRAVIRILSSPGKSRHTMRNKVTERVVGIQYARKPVSSLYLYRHADGSMKFWDASHVLLQILYKLKTAKIFEKPKAKSLESQDDDPFAIQQISLCPESRFLAVANTSCHVILFHFSKSETITEVPVSLCLSVCRSDLFVHGNGQISRNMHPAVFGRSRRRDTF